MVNIVIRSTINIVFAFSLFLFFFNTSRLSTLPHLLVHKITSSFSLACLSKIKLKITFSSCICTTKSPQLVVFSSSICYFFLSFLWLRLSLSYVSGQTVCCSLAKTERLTTLVCKKRFVSAPFFSARILRHLLCLCPFSSPSFLLPFAISSLSSSEWSKFCQRATGHTFVISRHLSHCPAPLSAIYYHHYRPINKRQRNSILSITKFVFFKRPNWTTLLRRKMTDKDKV